MNGKENPADILSRGREETAIPRSWFVGPAFLHDYRGSRKVEAKTSPNVLEDDPELKSSRDFACSWGLSTLHVNFEEVEQPLET